MTTLTLPEVRPSHVDDDLTHLECCGDRALCGGHLTGDYEPDAPDEDMCVVCLDLDEVDARCGGPFCRTRQWFRRERSWPW